MELVVRWETLSNKDRECFPTFVTAFALYGSLNHITLLFQFLVVVVFCLMFCWHCTSFLDPAFVSASLYDYIYGYIYIYIYIYISDFAIDR